MKMSYALADIQVLITVYLPEYYKNFHLENMFGISFTSILK